MKKYSEIVDELRAADIGMYIIERESLNGVPHLVITSPNGETYSVCYFGKSNSYRIFYPYPSKNQVVITIKTNIEVINYFKILINSYGK